MNTVFISVYIPVHICLHTVSSYSRKECVLSNCAKTASHNAHTYGPVHKHLSNVVDFTSTAHSPRISTGRYKKYTTSALFTESVYITQRIFVHINMHVRTYPSSPLNTEPKVLNFHGAQESIPRNQFRQLM
jgi:hypothetical protein